jgi:adenosylcobinamide-GDP ribazoletransferase
MKTQGKSPLAALMPWLIDTASCMRFFSRLPVPRLGADDDPATLPDFSRAARTMPIAGALISLPAVAVLLLLSATALPAMAVATLTLVTLIAVSGGLHEDGLADVADGFFGAQKVERRLEIMKDSRVGTYGVLALVLALILAVNLLGELLTRHGVMTTALALIGANAISRAVALWPWIGLPCARPEGLAAQAGQPTAEAVVSAGVLAMLISIPLIVTLGLVHWLLALAGAGIAALGMALLARSKIGGHTGDVIGAAQQLATLAFLGGLLMLA